MRRPKSWLVGKDSEVLPMLLELHAPPKPRILDTTYGLGVMWKGIEQDWLPVRMDLDPARGQDFICDFLNMRLATYASRDNEGLPVWQSRPYDVLIWDPPHITDAGKGSTMRNLYGLGSPGLRAANIAHFFEPFLEQAKLVLKPDGIILAKLADQVHGGRHQWQQVKFINAVEAAGMTACDQIVKADPRAGTLQGLWKQVLHTRNSHCYWIVVRNGTACQRDALPSWAPPMGDIVSIPRFANLTYGGMSPEPCRCNPPGSGEEFCNGGCDGSLRELLGAAA